MSSRKPKKNPVAHRDLTLDTASILSSSLLTFILMSHISFLNHAKVLDSFQAEFSDFSQDYHETSHAVLR